MPLVVITGQPSSGKSTVAQQLSELFKASGRSCTIVDEPSLHLQRNAAYQNTANEKNTRSLLKSAVERSVCKETVTILDTLNNIKVHVDTPIETCAHWNSSRAPSDSYTQDIFQDLASRYETPDSRSRWDAPLFTVRPASASPDEQSEVLREVVAAMVDPAEARGSRSVRAKDLQPTVATSNAALQGTNVLHDIDRVSQEVINRVVDAQTAAGSGPPGVVELGEGAGSLRIGRPVTVAELRRHKRSFMKLATQITFARVKDVGAARRLFASHLQEQLQVSGG